MVSMRRFELRPLQPLMLLPLPLGYMDELANHHGNDPCSPG